MTIACSWSFSVTGPWPSCAASAWTTRTRRHRSQTQDFTAASCCRLLTVQSRFFKRPSFDIGFDRHCELIGVVMAARMCRFLQLMDMGCLVFTNHFRVLLESSDLVNYLLYLHLSFQVWFCCLPNQHLCYNQKRKAPSCDHFYYQLLWFGAEWTGFRQTTANGLECGHDQIHVDFSWQSFHLSLFCAFFWFAFKSYYDWIYNIFSASVRF